ncbi:hypothetical protein [Halobacillus massiliensis]|uniref:hypothetical protein n=1 Tax=Halobacillus massiliensis TaxID=1926286 RepID=UPI0015C45165|nr:hypothetical protein [Halobacillus massiliensis]
MITHLEMKLFYKELRRLKADLKKAEADNNNIKELITSHIELIQSAISEAKVKS